MRQSSRYIGLFALALCGVPESAAAAPITTAPIVTSFGAGVSVSVTDSFSGGQNDGAANTANGASYTTLDVAKYSGSDILVGVQLGLSSTRSATGSGSGSGGSGTRNATGQGSSTGQFSAPGATSSTFAALGASGSCSSGSGNCTMSVSGSSQNPSFSTSVTTGLASYYGPGTFAATLSAPSLTALAGGTKNNVTFTYSSTWSGTLTTTYEYIKHANASFDGASDLNSLTINVGDVLLNSWVQQSFSIFNLLDAAGMTAALDLDSIMGSGDTTKLGTNLASFTSLAAGGQKDFIATFDTSALGSYGASYTLNFSDEDVGVGGASSTLTLNLAGRVIAPAVSTASVPEPVTLALLSLALAGIGIARRRRHSAK